jgi:peptidoglycan/xylan/chitin deacetylase (PgdA/CDA1 family)
VPSDYFERQLQILAKQGWTPTTFTEAVLNPPARRTLAITFDDAFASVREFAEPVLAARGWRATVFAPTAFMSERQPLHWQGIEHWQSSPHATEVTSMDWSDLGELTERGWEVGSHTRTHPHLSELSDESLSEELSLSREECERQLGGVCRSIAYPYGDVDQRIVEMASSAGYAAGAGLSRDLRRLGPLRWPRVGIYNGDVERRFRLKIAPIVRRQRASRLWPIL